MAGADVRRSGRSPGSPPQPCPTPPATVPIGLILASAFSAIVVYAQELEPSRVGLIAWLSFGFAFGMGGLGAAALGWWADRAGIEAVYRACSVLPLIGLLTVLLPDLDGRRPHGT